MSVAIRSAAIIAKNDAAIAKPAAQVVRRAQNPAIGLKHAMAAVITTAM